MSHTPFSQGQYNAIPPTLTDGEIAPIELNINGYTKISADVLPLPTGASTEAKQPSLGSPGAPATDTITVQGATGMVPVQSSVVGAGSAAAAAVGGPVYVGTSDANGTLRQMQNVQNFADGINQYPLQVHGYLYNGASYDRQRGNWNTTTGDTGTKVATFNGATQTNYDSKGAIITILLGTVSGTTPTLAAQLQVSPDAGTTWFNMGPALANLTASSQTGMIMVYPTNISQAAGVTPVDLTTGATAQMSLNMHLPQTWRLVYTIGAVANPSFAITSVPVAYLR